MTPEAIIISDIHLGSELTRHKELTNFLASVPSETKLIINGDVLHEPRYRKIIQNGHGAILDTLSRRRNKIIIAGNHDVDAATLARHTDSDVMNEYSLTSGNKKFLVLHGHQFDPIEDSKRNSLRRTVGNALYKAGKVITRSENFMLFLRGVFENVTGTLFPIKPKALMRAQRHGYDGIIVGHSHHAQLDGAGDVVFANTGSWLKHHPCTYVRVHDGEISLHTYKA